MTKLWTGNVCVSEQLLEILAIIRTIGTETDERHEMIGHWLWCLRDRNEEPPQESAGVPEEIPTRDQNQAGGSYEPTQRSKKRPRTQQGEGNTTKSKAKRGRNKQRHLAIELLEPMDGREHIELWRDQGTLCSDNGVGKNASIVKDATSSDRRYPLDLYTRWNA